MTTTFLLPLWLKAPAVIGVARGEPQLERPELRVPHLESDGQRRRTRALPEAKLGHERCVPMHDLLVERDVRAVFVESSVPRKSIDALVEGAQSRGKSIIIGGELFSDAMGSPGSYEGTYIGMLDHNLTLVARGLGGSAPERGFHGKLSVSTHSHARDEASL